MTDFLHANRRPKVAEIGTILLERRELRGKGKGEKPTNSGSFWRESSDNEGVERTSLREWE